MNDQHNRNTDSEIAVVLMTPLVLLLALLIRLAAFVLSIFHRSPELTTTTGRGFNDYVVGLVDPVDLRARYIHTFVCPNFYQLYHDCNCAPELRVRR